MVGNDPLLLQSSDGISDGLAWALTSERQESTQRTAPALKPSAAPRQPPGRKAIWRPLLSPPAIPAVAGTATAPPARGQLRGSAAAPQQHRTPPSLSSFSQGKGGRSTTVRWGQTAPGAPRGRLKIALTYPSRRGCA